MFIITALLLACEQQTHFRSSLLSLGGREATTGNASAVRRLHYCLITFLFVCFCFFFGWIMCSRNEISLVPSVWVWNFPIFFSRT